MGTIKRGVSLYSLQDEYARKKLDLEGLLRLLKEFGAEGVELISDQMIHGSPNPAGETIENWLNLTEKYGLERVSNDIFINSTLYRNRRLTIREQSELLKQEIINAHNLGFRLVRLVSDTDQRLICPALETAEKYDVEMGLEIHAGASFQTPITKAYIEEMLRLNSPYVGVVLDCGIFCARHPRVARAYFTQLGLSPEVADYIDRIFERGSDPFQAYGLDGWGGQPKFPEGLKALIKNDIDMQYATFATGYENTPLSALDPYISYIKSIHGKNYEMTEDCEEYSICYKDFIEYLYEKDWSGYICTEYEGNRFTLLDEEVDSVENVRRHQEMLKKYLKR